MFARGEAAGTHDAADAVALLAIWKPALKRALGDLYPGDRRVTVGPVDEMTRTLAVGEAQATVFLDCGDALRRDQVFSQLRLHFRVVVHFLSVSGDEMSTIAQFEPPRHIKQEDARTTRA